MIEETARVLELDGRFAWVEATRTSACGACESNKGCGTSVLSKVFAGKTTRLRVINEVGAVVGEQVMVGLDESAFLRGSLAMYLIPLLGLIGGGLCGQWLALTNGGNAELSSALGAVAGLVSGLVWLRGFSRRIADDLRYQPVIVRRLGVAGLCGVAVKVLE